MPGPGLLVCRYRRGTFRPCSPAGHHEGGAALEGDRPGRQRSRCRTPISLFPPRETRHSRRQSARLALRGTCRPTAGAAGSPAGPGGAAPGGHRDDACPCCTALPRRSPARPRRPGHGTGQPRLTPYPGNRDALTEPSAVSGARRLGLGGNAVPSPPFQAVRRSPGTPLCGDGGPRADAQPAKAPGLRWQPATQDGARKGQRSDMPRLPCPKERAAGCPKAATACPLPARE